MSKDINTKTSARHLVDVSPTSGAPSGRQGHELDAVYGAGPEGLATIVHVVGARPNFVKMAPIVAALEPRGAFRQVVVHTGQHYDASLSDDILADLDFPPADY